VPSLAGRALTVGSLFAGIGGFDLGLERAGMRTVWQVEKNDYCRRVLARHFPDAKRFEDVRYVGRRELARVDVIAAGVPCQPISGAGLGLGERDERWLWPDTLRIIGELRPQYAVLENPAIFLGRGAAGVLGALAVIGYDAEWKIVSACSVGASHMRRRVFIVAYPASVGQNGRGSSRATWQSHEPARCDQGARRRWSEESRPFGVADGVPNRVDRLGALGNAVVPQVAEWLGRRIVEHELPHAEPRGTGGACCQRIWRGEVRCWSCPGR